MSIARDLPELVQQAGRRLGDAPFLSVADTTVTGRVFANRVRDVGARLLADGFQPGDRLVVLLERSIDEAVALLAAACVGGIAVPVSGKLKDDQVRHLVRDAEPFAVVTSALRVLALRDGAGLLAGCRLYRSGAAGLPLPSRPLTDDATADPPAGEARAGIVTDPSRPAVLLYTSGSTGLAKGVVQTHGNLVRGATVVADYLGMGAEDHILALLPLSFDYGLNQLLLALHAGCRISGADHLGGGELAELLLAVQPTVLAGVPSLWHEVARALSTGTLSAEHGESLRRLTNSGGALRPADSAELRRHWPEAAVFAMYGLTEAFRSAFLPPEEFDRYPGSFGAAIDGVELLLIDTRTGAVIDGEGTGELVHAGALVAAGYWRRPAETAARFRPDPRGGGRTVVYSGDLVRRDRDGRHWFEGRLDRMLKVQGHRVSPDEVASAFADVEGVGEVAVWGVDGGAQGQRIVLAVAGDRTDPDLVRRLEQRGRARLPSYMVPARLIVLDSLPHNSHGKVDEGALREKIASCIEDT